MATLNGVVVFDQVDPHGFLVVPRELAGSPILTPASFAFGDCDRDGDLDLVTANIQSNLSIFLQTTPAFAAPRIVGGIVTTPDPVDVSAADVDGDGEVDLLSANSTGGTVTVFWNGS